MIHFYGYTKEYGEFSNFYDAPIIYQDNLWPTSEHLFQAQKFINNKEYSELIRKAKNPAKAKSLGNTRMIKIRDDWESTKDDIMYMILKLKFDQHPKLKQLLLSTKGKQLIEHTQKDKYWADGGDGSGKNMLGKLLCKLRDTY